MNESPKNRRIREDGLKMASLRKLEVTFPRVLGPGRRIMAVLSMSKREFSRLDVLLRVRWGRLRVADAFALMGLRPH